MNFQPNILLEILYIVCAIILTYIKSRILVWFADIGICIRQGISHQHEFVVTFLLSANQARIVDSRVQIWNCFSDIFEH